MLLHLNVEHYLPAKHIRLHREHPVPDAPVKDRHRASGVLKLSVPVSFGIRHLAPLWSEFLALHPQVTLYVQLADRVIDLVDEGFDLASGQLVEILAQYRSVELGIYAVYPSRKFVLPKVRALVEFHSARLR